MTLVLVSLDGVPNVFHIQHLPQSFELETYRAGGVQSVLVDEHEEVGEHGPFAEKGQAGVMSGRARHVEWRLSLIGCSRIRGGRPRVVPLPEDLSSSVRLVRQDPQGQALWEPSRRRQGEEGGEVVGSLLCGDRGRDRGGVSRTAER